MLKRIIIYLSLASRWGNITPLGILDEEKTQVGSLVGCHSQLEATQEEPHLYGCIGFLRFEYICSRKILLICRYGLKKEGKSVFVDVCCWLEIFASKRFKQ